MQVVLLSGEKLVENAIEVYPELAMTITRSMVPWEREAALALLVQEAKGRAPIN